MLKANKRQTQIAIKKASSLLSRIESMIDDDTYCIDIMQQILAVNGLLKSVTTKMLENHLKTCFTKAVESKDKRKQKAMIEEIMKIFKLLQK